MLNQVGEKRMVFPPAFMSHLASLIIDLCNSIGIAVRIQNQLCHLRGK